MEQSREDLSNGKCRRDSMVDYKSPTIQDHGATINTTPLRNISILGCKLHSLYDLRNNCFSELISFLLA